MPHITTCYQFIIPHSLTILITAYTEKSQLMIIFSIPVAKIGFDMSESPKGSPLVIKEGQTRQVCVSVFEPEQLDRFMELTIILLGPATPGALANSECMLLFACIFTLCKFFRYFNYYTVLILLYDSTCTHTHML